MTFADEFDYESDPEEDAKQAQMEEMKQQRRQMLIATLKNSKGRKRFMEWLYRSVTLNHNKDS